MRLARVLGVDLAVLKLRMGLLPLTVSTWIEGMDDSAVMRFYDAMKTAVMMREA